MRAVFFGTPEWAVPSLESIRASGMEVAAVVTNPDRPAGRGMEPRPSPVKTAAMQAGLDVIEERARDPKLLRRLEDLAPDVAPVVAYGSILSPALLEVPRLGFVNLHFSLLPAYRGAAPVQRALMEGTRTTGVSVMLLTEGMDEGPVLDLAAVDVDPDETAGELGSRLARLGAPLLADAILRYDRGEVEPAPQDHAAATYAPKVSSADARIDWATSGRAIHDHVRGLNPAPGAWTTLHGGRLKIHRVQVAPAPRPLAPGEMEWDGRSDPLIGTGDGAVIAVAVQAAGKTRMSGAELARGLRLEPGARVE